MQTTTASPVFGIIPLVFGAIFNLVANNGNESLAAYTIKVIVYVSFYFIIKVLADYAINEFFTKKKDKSRIKYLGRICLRIILSEKLRFPL